MFKKLVSNLAFSPTTIDQISFYSRRLKQEDSIRRLGLVLIVFSMFIQIFAAMIPPEKSLAASDNDVIRGGISTIGQLKKAYETKTDVRALYDRFGLGANSMNTTGSAKNTTFNFQEQGSKGTRTVGRVNFASTNDNNLGNLGGSNFYSRSAGEWQGSAEAYFFDKQKGTDGKYYYVWIIKDCGNIAYRLAEGQTTQGPISAIAPPVAPPPAPPAPPATPPPATPPATSEVACTGLRSDRTAGKKSVTARLTASYSDTGPNLVNGFTFNFGDGTSYRHNGPIIDHTYTNNGTQPVEYVTTVTINTTLGDRTSEVCKVSIVVEPETPPPAPVTPTTPPPAPVTPTVTTPPPAPVCANDATLKPDDARCKCLDNPDIAATNPNCTTPGRTKTAQNLTQKLDTQQTLVTKAKAGDVIEYNLVTKNSNIVDKKNHVIEDYVGDLLDYADLDLAFLAQQGGTFSAQTKIITWANQTLPAGGEVKKTFRVTLKSVIPSTNRPNATATDYDCKMQNGYGNETIIPVDCSVLKTVDELPNTGPGTTVAVAFTIAVVSGYFFMRGRLLAKELRIVKRTHQAGY